MDHKNEEYIKPKCEDCGDEGEQVRYTACPYASETHSETVMVTLCDNCYHERCMAI